AVSAAYFGIVLVMTFVAGFPPAYGIGVAAAALAVVMLVAVVLVLRASDEELDEHRVALRRALTVAGVAEATRLTRPADPAPRDRPPAPAPTVALADDDGPFQPLTKQCPMCAETILAGARKCKHCGEVFDARLRAERQSGE